MAREHSEAELVQHLARHPRTAVPRRSEHRLHHPRQPLRQQLETFSDVTTLRVEIAPRAKLALASRRLMTDVGQAVLVQAKPAILLAGERHQRRCELGAERSGNDGNVKRQSPARKHLQQREQARVLPTSVVVAKKEDERRRRLVKGGSQRLKPRASSALGFTHAGILAVL